MKYKLFMYDEVKDFNMDLYSLFPYGGKELVYWCTIRFENKEKLEYNSGYFYEKYDDNPYIKKLMQTFGLLNNIL